MNCYGKILRPIMPIILFLLTIGIVKGDSIYDNMKTAIDALNGISDNLQTENKLINENSETNLIDEIISGNDFLSALNTLSNDNGLQTLKNTLSLLKLVETINSFSKTKLNKMLQTQSEFIDSLKNNTEFNIKQENIVIFNKLTTMIKELENYFTLNKFYDYISTLKDFIYSNSEKFEGNVKSDLENLQTLISIFKSLTSFEFLKGEKSDLNANNNSEKLGSIQLDQIKDFLNLLSNKNSNSQNEFKAENSNMAEIYKSSENNINQNGNDFKGLINKIIETGENKLDAFKSVDINKMYEDLKRLGIASKSDKMPDNPLNIGEKNKNNYSNSDKHDNMILMIICISLIILIIIFISVIFFMKKRNLLSSEIEYSTHNSFADNNSISIENSSQVEGSSKHFK